ncbi:MAG: DUF3413 domain-containing protein [Anaerobiospirillum succiniciproducens]|uniref:DUF3413 domain-containing protein n=1 Tax=Anaerobiospirillum succiniciproducens TaxID=13335 RepID=UPI002A752053|nr:DUF3413 domain-containing protein [Anaerobiospirillum succiniciproducens]MDY2798250.1 DUF3413 domain-containing protein [Anaerobiospirillum succiniciproducens]
MSDGKHSLKRFSYKEQVSRSITWGHYFIFVNMLLSCLLGLSYVYAAPPATDFLSFVYLVVTSLGHMSFLAVVFYMVLLFPLAFIGNFRYYRVIAVILTVIGHTALLFDIKIYLAVKVHLSMTALNLIIRELDFSTGLNYNFLFIAVPIVIGLELFFAKITTHSLYRDHHPYAVRSILITLISCFICSHILHIWADATKYERITLLRSSFPVHYPMTARSFLSSHGWLNNEVFDANAAANIADYMEYPLGKITVDEEQKPKNVITISLNGLSYNDLTQENSKNLMDFKSYAQSFENHYLLYKNEIDNVYSMNFGLPLQYRRALYSGNILPVPFETMYRQDYVRRLILSDASFSDPNLIANKRHYYSSLLEASALAPSQMSHASNVREMFIEAFRQISLYNSFDKRPYELTLVINDLRDFKEQAAARARFAKNYKVGANNNSDLQSLSTDKNSVTIFEDDETLPLIAAELPDDESEEQRANVNAMAQARAQEFASIINSSAKALIDKEKDVQSSGEDDPMVAARLMYESSLHHVDALFAVFLRELSLAGLLKDTMIIVTACEGNQMLKPSSEVFDRGVQHVPLMILWADRERQNTAVQALTSHQDICATYGATAVNITTPEGNYTLGRNLNSGAGHRILISDSGDSLILIGDKHNTVFSSDGSSFVERDGRILQARPELESLIESTRDLNRFVR